LAARGLVLKLGLIQKSAGQLISGCWAFCTSFGLSSGASHTVSASVHLILALKGLELMQQNGG